MNIGIVGLGYVGLTFAIAAADAGITVYGIEVNPEIKDSLAKKRALFFEPGLDELIAKNSGKNFFCVEEFPRHISFDAFVITVGTPLRSGKIPDFDYIRQALVSIGRSYTGQELVVLRSTVSVGTTREIVMPALANLADKSTEVLVAMCPERTVEGNAISELRQLPQIISGNNDRALAKAEEIFRIITPKITKAESLEQAELAKLFCNTFRDMNFALGNALCLAAQQFGVDGMATIDVANKGYARTAIPMPGFVGGPCLEKDAYILTNNMGPSQSRDLITDSRYLNESLEDLVVQWVERLCPSSEKDSSIVAISGLAFKGVPQTSDLRGSSSVHIAQALFERGYRLHLHDFVASRKALENLALGEVFDSVQEACQDAAVLLILNNNPHYAALRPFPAVTKGRLYVLDAWNVCAGLRETDGFVTTLGAINLPLSTRSAQAYVDRRTIQ